MDAPTRRQTVLGACGSVLATALGAPARAQADKRLTVTATGSLAIANPYGYSGNQLYSLWGQTYGMLGRYDYVRKEYAGVLAESWSTVDDRTWRFKLRTDLKRHDGGPAPTSRDVVHSWQRALTDPASAQAFTFAEVETIRPIDDASFDIVTRRPLGQLLSYLFDRFPITSADLFEKHGAAADRDAPWGWGPYKNSSFTIDQQAVVLANPDWPGLSPDAPRTVVFRQINEPEQRVTALLNGEVQIARLIPPQLIDRMRNRPDVSVLETGSLEFMFLAMNPKFKPWDDGRVRRAAALAINRDLIIQRLLFGLADKMEGAIGPFQNCAGPAAGQPGYDPRRARELLAEAGYPNGVDVELFSPSGRYISDRQVAEAIAQMLRQVGFRVTLQTPDYVGLFGEIRKGACPFYYFGRGATPEPAEPLSSYFESSARSRTNFSSPAVDALFAAVRATFDPQGQCTVLKKLNDQLVAETAAVFLWTHKLVQGVRRGVTWKADVDGEIWLPDVRV